MKILLLNGPNMDMLGIRKPEVYGTQTLEDIEHMACEYAAGLSDASGAPLAVECRQSNVEGELIDALHAAHFDFDAVVYNPGAHAHYSYALRDAVEAIATPVVEVHMSDTDSREDFRKIDVIAPVCAGRVCGLGAESYLRAIDLCLGFA